MTRNNRADRVLLVDDDPMSREVLAVVLSSDGYDVECAESGGAALAWLARAVDPVSVVLTDVQMPGLAGAPLGAALREQCGPGTVILAMSASEVSDEILHAFDGFLLKPFRAHDLAAVVADFRARERAAEPQQARGVMPSAPAKTSNAEMDAKVQNGGSEQNPSGTAAPPGALDERIYGQLNDSMPPVQVRQMYGMCIEDVRRRIGEMRAHAEAQQGEQFARQAHAIKGGCGMLGASELYRMASELERTGIPANQGDSAPGVNPLDELWAACDRLERILATRI